MYKYRYLGTQEVHLPKFGITVKQGDIVETKYELNNPDFELVKDESKQKKEDK